MLADDVVWHDIGSDEPRRRTLSQDTVLIAAFFT